LGEFATAKGGSVTGITDNFRLERLERRAAKRHEVLLPVIVRAAAQQCCSARIRDVSTGGAYLFVESDELSVDTNVQLTLSLPKEITAGMGALMLVFGKIIRVDRLSEDETQPIGVAVVFDTYHFIPLTSSFISAPDLSPGQLVSQVEKCYLHNRFG
jgi:hypothetical protein